MLQIVKEAGDITPYQRLGISYNYTPTESWLNKFSVQLAQQKSHNRLIQSIWYINKLLP